MKPNSKTFLAVNFGCRVNSAETNLWSQNLINEGFVPFPQGGPQGVSPDLILVNTCAVTKKGELESLGKIRHLSAQYPNSSIIATGCAKLEKVSDLKNLIIVSNSEKEKKLADLKCEYSHQILDKFSHTNRYLLKIQSGCTQFCSYCTVPFRRPYLWSITLPEAVNAVNKAVSDGYTEVIITGVNIDQYQYSLSNLVSELLSRTKIKLISFGSVPINSIDDKFICLFSQYPDRLSPFLHIPIQSGSDKILGLMHRPYNKTKMLAVFKSLSKISTLTFGTDVIVGFPGETDSDFQETLDLCQKIGFTKIHVFRFSPRPGTKVRIIYENQPNLAKSVLSDRSRQVRGLLHL